MLSNIRSVATIIYILKIEMDNLENRAHNITTNTQILAVVLPVYNEEQGIVGLLDEIILCIDVDQPIVLVLVDDGSQDNSYNEMLSYKPSRENVEKFLVRLTRNFGHQSALMAGLHHVPDYCDVIAVLDADYQDQPSDIPKLLKHLVNGVDCVYAVRKPNAQSFLINFLTKLFYAIQKRLAGVAIPSYAGSFSVFSKNFLNNLKSFPENDIYFPGLRALIGYTQVAVPVERAHRKFETSRVGMSRLLSLGMTGILGFSIAPTRLIFITGVLTTALCIILGMIVLTLRLLGVIQVLGFTSLALFILGLFGIQIMCTGVVGEYIGRIFLEIKERPRWLVRDRIHQSCVNKETIKV